MSAVQLREAQLLGVQMLREGFAAGHRCQMLYAGTGFGKTEVAISMMEQAAEKGNRSTMILDRRNLVNQTSQRLDRYKIPHGVIMAQSGRLAMHEPIQICSAQTLEKRGTAAGNKVLFVDEAHQIRKETKRFIERNKDIFVVGLSATPLTKGLGKVFSRVVSPTTTDALVAQGLLIMPTIYCAKEVDTDGLKKVAGEWSSDDVGKRAMKITGDIVATWIEKTTIHFGGPVKTIVHCASVAHGAELQQKFADAGHNFLAVSYKDDEDFKEAAYVEFSKADSSIVGLIAVDMLTKGFDCILEGSKVLTDSGLVEIDKLSLSHKLWDGVEFVNHGGAVYKGERNVITYHGLTATPDHKVFTKYGWLEFGECARNGIEIVRSGCVLSALQARSNVAGLSLQGHARALRKSISQGIQKLRRTWNKIQFCVVQRWRGLDSSEHWNTGEKPEHSNRQDQQRRELRTRQSSMGFARTEQLEHKAGRLGCGNAQIQDCAPGNKVFGQDFPKSFELWPVFCSDSGAFPQEIRQTKGRVWDVLNAGPRNRFTCEDLLVHNCPDVLCSVMARPFSKSVSSIIQQFGRVMRTAPGKTAAICIDHAGNFLRHGKQIFEIFADGIHELDDGAEKAAKELTKKEKEACKCPKCSALWIGKSDTCSACGYVRPSRSKVEHVPGQLSELERKKSDRAERQDFYSQLLGYADGKKYSPGWAVNRFKEKFGDFPNGLSKDLKPCGPKVSSYIRSRNIAWAKQSVQASPSAAK